MKHAVGDLSAYVLPGRPVDPLDAFVQAKAAEDMGLGTIWASERWETKETGAMCGALAHATSKVKIAAGMTHFGTRHPLVLAGLGSTMQFLSGGRFIMGFGRSTASLWPDMGLRPVTTQVMAEYSIILRRLWQGEEVSYDGVCGRFPKIRMAQIPKTSPPLMLAAAGPKTLALAGSHFDAVALHPFLTTDGVAKSAAIVRRAAQEAGRDPKSVTVYAAVVVAPDLSPEEQADVLDARIVSYFIFPDMGGAVVNMNGWDPEPHKRVMAENLGMIEREQLSHHEIRARMSAAAKHLPREWITTGAAVGSTAQCAARLREYREAGADNLVLHGTTADKLGPLVAAYVKGS